MPIPVIKTWTANEILKAADLNGNFATIRDAVNAGVMWRDSAVTVTVTHTFAVTQTFSQGLTVTANGLTITAGGLTVAAGGIAITGASSVTGTLGVSNTLTVSAGGLTVSSGTTAVQALTATMVTAGGLVTAQSGLTVSSGNVAVSSGNVAVTAGTLTVSTGLTTLAQLRMTGAAILGISSADSTRTQGHAYLPFVNGVPTGVPAEQGTSFHVAMIWNTGDSKLYIYVPSIGWKASPAFT